MAVPVAELVKLALLGNVEAAILATAPFIPWAVLAVIILGLIAVTHQAQALTATLEVKDGEGGPPRRRRAVVCPLSYGYESHCVYTCTEDGNYIYSIFYPQP